MRYNSVDVKVAFFPSAERNCQCNFGRGYQEEQFYEITNLFRICASGSEDVV